MIQILYHPNMSLSWLSAQQKVLSYFLSPTKLCWAENKGSPLKATCVDVRVIQQNTESHTALAGQCACTLDCAQECPQGAENFWPCCRAHQASYEEE